MTILYFPNSGTFILPKLHICRFKKKIENLFRSGGQSVGHYKQKGFGAHGFGSERASLVVQVKERVHPASAQNVQDQSFKQKGLVAHGFGTERARLVVQVKELRYAASRLIGALRFARGFKKVPITHKETRLIGALRFAGGFKKVPITHKET